MERDFMYGFRDLGMRKSICPKERFEQLAAGEWKPVFERVFRGESESAMASFRSAHERFFAKRDDGQLLHQVPPEHAKAHIEFNLRSIGLGWKGTGDITKSVEENYRILAARPVLPPGRDLRANALHGFAVTLAFLDQRQMDWTTERGKLQFLKKIAEADILEDPLFLAVALSQVDEILRTSCAKSRPISDQMLELAANELVLIHLKKAEESQFPSQELERFDPQYEKRLADTFHETERPLDLGSRFTVYALDGQIGPRSRMLPEELETRIATKLASILTYGIVPGGIVGSEINYHQIHLGLSRADIDLLTIYPDSQAVVMIPMDSGVIHGRFPHTIRKGNARVWHNGDAARSDEIKIEPLDGWLPRISPENFAIILPEKLDGLFRKALAELRAKLGFVETPRGIFRNVVPYNPAVWGNVHDFVEFLQTTEEGNARIQSALRDN